LIKYLKRFATTLLAFSPKARLKPQEVLSRFIPKASWYKGNVVLLDAFMPARDDETSTHRLQGVAKWRVRTLGRLVASAYHGGKLQGRAFLMAGDVQGTNGLWLKADRLSLHVGILGWSNQKPQQKIVAALLAKKAHMERY